MSSTIQSVVSLLAAGTMLITNTAHQAAPQNDFTGTLFLVNRQWRISEVYVPKTREVTTSGRKPLAPEVADAYETMVAACKEETGMTLLAVSGYRSYDHQSRLYSNKLKAVKTEAKADEYVARPGASEHQTGFAMDVGQVNTTNLTTAFRDTKGGIWLRENCWRFGFIIRYGEDWEAVTGYKYEPWHVRYVGLETAASLHENPEPLETWLLDEREDRMLTILGVTEE